MLNIGRNRVIAAFHRLLSPKLGQLWQYRPRRLRLPPHYADVRLPKSPPSIALVTPSLNQGHFLERTLQSVLDQAYPRLQYVVQDGGSTDETISILKEYGPYLHYWKSSPDAGQAQAINRGFLRTASEIMAYLNADDLLLPGALAYVADYFYHHPPVDVVYGHRILIDEHDREVGRWVLPPHCDAALLWEDYIPQETLFWRRSIWEKVGAALDESYHFALDWELLLRFHKAGAVFARLPRFLGAFRVHSQQKTATQMEQRGRSEIEKLQRIYHGHVLSRQEVQQRVKWYLRQHAVLNLLHRLGCIHY